FETAKQNAPAIIFIDELDAIGRARGSAVIGGGHSEQEQTLNQILIEMDGFSSRQGVIVLAATNRPDVLDPALLRPGRFDRQVTVQAPDRVGREAILKVHTQRVPLAPDVELRALASATPGLVGADLRNLVNEAALFAARRNRAAVHRQDFTDALEKLLLGPARKLFLTERDRRRVAYHEGGHTIVGLLVPGADPVTRVTIMPRGRALGVTYQQPQDDRQGYDEPYLRARITGALGGRAAEEVVYGVRTTFAADDLQVATDLARQMVTRWGMAGRFGALALAPRAGGFAASADGFHAATRPFSEATAQLVDREVQQILDDCYAAAMRLLHQHRHRLDALAEALLERESLDEADILAVTGLGPRLAAAS
ncbi:MAG: AAA family ATPase, partial [Chloroflexota bacterium]|nr:AAA family ATPase [Chloroflexota bacterium]